MVPTYQSAPLLASRIIRFIGWNRSHRYNSPLRRMLWPGNQNILYVLGQAVICDIYPARKDERQLGSTIDLYQPIRALAGHDSHMPVAFHHLDGRCPPIFSTFKHSLRIDRRQIRPSGSKIVTQRRRVARRRRSSRLNIYEMLG